MLLTNYSIKLLYRSYLKSILKLVLHAFYLFPIQKNKIIFESFNGKQISCNPYYIYNYLKKTSPNLNLIWSINSKNVFSQYIPTNIKYTKRYSLSYFYHILTCNIFISNNQIPYYIPFRKKQTTINTWHGGGAYKQVGIRKKRLTNIQYKTIYKIAQSTTYFISSSNIFTDIMSESTCIDKARFLAFGMPRNDVFFNKQLISQYTQNIHRAFNISNDSFIILYAPTFRNNNLNPSFNFELDVARITESVQKRFSPSNVIFLFRGHHTFTKQTVQINQRIINVSDYPFMQELLCSANMLISDYSSCIWDYSFLYRPCILFTPDLKQYQDETDFYYPIRSWGFPIAETNEELCSVIESFQEKPFRKNMEMHHLTLQSYEQGNATILLTQLITQQINK